MGRELILGTVCLLFGVFALRKDRRIRRGDDRSWVKNYRDQGMFWLYRNGFLALRFLGLSSLCMAGGVLLYVVGPMFLTAIVGLPLMLIGFVLGTYGLYRMYQEADYLKPAWLLEEERIKPRVDKRSRLTKALDFLPIGSILAFVVVALVAGVAELVVTIAQHI